MTLPFTVLRRINCVLEPIKAVALHKLQAKTAKGINPERLLLRAARLDKLIGNFAGLSTRAAEAVATLYAIWNDALMDGASPPDAEIVTAFLTKWHEEKQKKFGAAELPTWLDWLRRCDLVPIGSGQKTSTERLFA